MKRIAAATAVLTASGVLLLGSAGIARADTTSPPQADVGCGGGYVGGALTTGLHYRYRVWDATSVPDHGSLGIDAPRGWSFVRTPQAEGRFHDPDDHDLLSLREPSRAATPQDAMAAQVRALAGTSGLKVLGQHVTVENELGQRWATLTYRWSSMGEPRIVKQRWIAYGTDASSTAVLVITVAGRVMDGNGLNALLDHVSPTATLAG